MSSEILRHIVKETAGTLFHMSVNDMGEWKIYIYKSRMIFIGELETICELAANEFTNNRVENISKHFRFKSRKYNYAPSPVNKNKPEIDFSCRNGSYNDKLKFAKQLGFDNVGIAISNIGVMSFNNQYNKHRNEV
jgi:hypothetical protein